MASWNPISWLSGSALLQDEPNHTSSGTRRVTVALIYGSVIIPAWFWVSQVTKHVPEPYLDEVFHIPQAQKYCDGQYQVWDPKITTPPGLYAFATAFVKVVGGRVCNVYSLRLFNTIVLLMTMAYASACRDLIIRLSKVTDISKITTSWLNTHKFISFDTVHTAVNTVLFPPLFFFSGLFYTDVLSTAVVLCMYMTFLRRPGAYSDSTEGSFRLYVIGIVALTMRQTNIFWVAILMGGLEAVRTIKGIPTSRVEPGKIPRNREEVLVAFEKYKRGEIHDVALSTADVPDFILCAASIAVAIIYNPLLILTRLWPYIALLLSFVGFVIWNGGVVLGDKSNHIATLHLPQLLYLTAFTSFFSLPLYIPSILHILRSSLPRNSSSWQPPQPATAKPKPTAQKALIIFYTLLTLVLTLAIIKTNTIIHPFTLADNRHYIFYVFRYSILRHWSIRYLLAPIYILSGWLGYQCLRGSPLPIADPIQNPSSPPSQKTSSPTYEEPTNEVISVTVCNTAEENPKTTTTTTSFLLIYLLTTTLSLITAPLVEPRYFILPWLLWRLHIPPLPHSQPTKPSRHDPRLYLETLYFLLINSVTGYVFLFRGFAWVQEPGRVQRFMW